MNANQKIALNWVKQSLAHTTQLMSSEFFKPFSTAQRLELTKALKKEGFLVLVFNTEDRKSAVVARADRSEYVDIDGVQAVVVTAPNGNITVTKPHYYAK